MTDADLEPAASQPPGFDTTTAHPARMWNHWLGGTHNFPADRAAAQAWARTFPGIVDVARAARALLARVVRQLAADVGVRQFLDIGAGLPTSDNTHQIAQRIAPECRVVYVDNDPLVLANTDDLLAGTGEGATAYVDADVRDPAKILSSAAETLDFTKPVALVMFGVMGNVADDDEARTIVRKLVDAVPSGSYLALNDGTPDAARTVANQHSQDSGGPSYTARPPDVIARFFTGLELLEPGVVASSLWRPDPGTQEPPKAVASHFGLGLKP